MYAWGSTINGELGLGGIEEEYIPLPRVLEWNLADTVIDGALGDNHTLLLTKEGKVYSCGCNDYGQLGHSQPRKRLRMSLFNPVVGMDAHIITHIACGSRHSMAINQWGQVFTWGSDYHGQLGHNMGEQVQSSAKLVKSLAKYHIIQICCGQRHSVALANTGEVLTWGANNFGQLGLGPNLQAIETTPKVVRSLAGLPIAFIACGANHTFIISKSGAVYGWGKNKQGQLGMNDDENKFVPTRPPSLRDMKVRYICCGEEFSVFLTLDGGVLTCGHGMYGQLGHGSNGSLMLPRQVAELMGSTITQVASGRQHSLAFVPSRGRIYSFGTGGSGQLGVRTPAPSSSSTPLIVMGPWVSPSGMSLVPTTVDARNLVVNRIFAGGDHCFATVIKKESKLPPYDCREMDPQTQILTITFDYIQNLLRIPVGRPVDQEVLRHLEAVFKSIPCINGSFLLEDDAHFNCSKKNHGINIEMADETFSLIGRMENRSIKELIWNCIVDDILPNLSSSPPNVEAMRIYLTLPFYHEFNNPNKYLRLQKPFASAILRMPDTPKGIIKTWWGQMSCDYLERLVNMFKNVASYILRNQNIPHGNAAFYDSSLVAMLDILRLLNNINHTEHGLKIPYVNFYLNDLSECLDVRFDYVNWITDPGTGRFHLCDYPFVFDARAKTQLLELDQQIQMQNAMTHAAREALIAAIQLPQIAHPIKNYLALNVSRERIVSDTLMELSMVEDSDLKKPLKVTFHGEEAEDAGGVTKEFFLLLLRAILDPQYGMFKEYEETRAIWFTQSTFEDEGVYKLIGMIFGLAIYNYTIIDVPFPLALYKKILGEAITLNDLRDLSPTMTNSLQDLLDHRDDDIEEVFCLDFLTTRDVFGHKEPVELKEDGANIPVNQANKAEYVNLLVNFIFNKSVEKQYESFYGGFEKVCYGRVLRLFHSHELMAVVVGNEDYDWHALEDAAEYKDGYKSSDEQIRWFWEVIHEMSLADKKKFLLFLTGSYRIPIQGMKGIKIFIRPTPDDRYLPVAHTCFNLLDLPKYQTKERLRYKLMQAIQQTEGFSLV